MEKPIGYYVHHQGRGHLRRARMIAAASNRPVVLIGTIDESGDTRDLVLPDDRIDAGFCGDDGEAGRPRALHYAPLRHAGVRARMAGIAAWVAANDPALLVVDVSVEVALFARLLSVPTMMVRLAGRRDDEPHLEAFRAAEALLAPFPAAFDDPATPDWIAAKTIYAGFLAPFRSHSKPARERSIVVVLGRGGTVADDTRLAAAAAATPDWTWDVHGQVSASGTTLPPNLRLHGWTERIDEAIDEATIVVGACGDGLLASVVTGRKRFVCLPEARPYEEQVAKARVLDALGLAVVLNEWPEARRWSGILRRADAIDTNAFGRFDDPLALRTIVAAIEAIADRSQNARVAGTLAASMSAGDG